MHMPTCSVDDLRYYAERYGALRDIYIPRDYYTSERAFMEEQAGVMWTSMAWQGLALMQIRVPVMKARAESWSGASDLMMEEYMVFMDDVHG